MSASERKQRSGSEAKVVDADGHVFEPDELWEQHLDPKFMDRRPRIDRDERGTTRYNFDGNLIPPGTGRGAWVPEGIVEASLKRDGGIDPKARLVDMDEEGIDVAILYATAALGCYAIADVDLSIACCRAFNDWLSAYCAVDPERLKGTPVLPMRSIPDACDEARRAVTELGFVSLTVPCAVFDKNPDDPVNDPLYSLAEELDVPVGFHAGGPRFCYDKFVDSYATLHAVEFAFDVMFAASTVVCGGVLDRFPKLRALFLEAGAAWGPYLFERLDEHWEKRPQEMPQISRAPSSYLDDGRIVISCEGEKHLPHALTGLGVHSIVYASDYPHWDAEFPDTVRHIADRTDLDDDEKSAVLGRNAARVYGWS